jgi:hypothetical protein
MFYKLKLSAASRVESSILEEQYNLVCARYRIQSRVIYCETPIPKAKRIGIGKLNNPAKRRVQYLAACFGVHARDAYMQSELNIIMAYDDKKFSI